MTAITDQEDMNVEIEGERSTSRREGQGGAFAPMVGACGQHHQIVSTGLPIF
jgi:hypothetical protein